MVADGEESDVNNEVAHLDVVLEKDDSAAGLCVFDGSLLGAHIVGNKIMGGSGKSIGNIKIYLVNTSRGWE